MTKPIFGNNKKNFCRALIAMMQILESHINEIKLINYSYKCILS